MESPLAIEKEQIPALQNVISEYPYFTSAQLLLTKAYHDSENLNFEKQLRLSAAYAADRKRLHELIHEAGSNVGGQMTVVSEKEETRDKKQETGVRELQDVGSSEVKPAGETSIEKTEISEEDAFLESQILTSAINSSILQEVGDDAEGIEAAAEEIASDQSQTEVEQQAGFNEFEAHSFSDWLKHYSGEEVRTSSSPQSEAIKAISDQAKSIQKKAEFFSASKMAKLSVIESNDLVTETLAQVYEAQGKYERAIQAYEKLQLKFPEKRVYFAGRIKAVEEKLKS